MCSFRVWLQWIPREITHWSDHHWSSHFQAGTSKYRGHYMTPGPKQGTVYRGNTSKLPYIKHCLIPKKKKVYNLMTPEVSLHSGTAFQRPQVPHQPLQTGASPSCCWDDPLGAPAPERSIPVSRAKNSEIFYTTTSKGGDTLNWLVCFHEVELLFGHLYPKRKDRWFSAHQVVIKTAHQVSSTILPTNQPMRMSHLGKLISFLNLNFSGILEGFPDPSTHHFAL